MKRNRLYILMGWALLLCAPVSAQQALPGRISTEGTQVTRDGQDVILSTRIRTGNLDLGTQEMVYVTPVLYAADSTQWHVFNPVIIAGGTRYKVLKREIGLNNTAFDSDPLAIVRHHKRRDDRIPVTLRVPYQEWMNNSTLVLYEDLTGCACEQEAKNTYVVMTPVLPVVYEPRFEVAFIPPPREVNKQRSETYAAHINFEVGRHVVLPDYKNNREVLKQVEQIFNELQSDNNLMITGFNITGYASPEGNAQSNLTLSKNRAQAFVIYLMDEYKIVPSQIRTDWKGEDWPGLREAVAKSDIGDRQRVLDIIDGGSDVSARKSRLQQLSGGATYRMLLRDYYPPLRRNEYTISFTVKGFDLNEAREMMKTKPHYLSQQEMYLVANSYPTNSREYMDVFHTIERLYPNDETAILNNAGAQLENGKTDGLVAKLQQMNRPEAWNNLGILAFNRKDYRQAANYFKRAADAGLQAGRSNMQQLNRFMGSDR